jgi:hypothetical protein
MVSKLKYSPLNPIVMAGEGHIADMITRMKNNQALKLQKKEKQKKLNELFRKDPSNNESAPIRQVEVSEEDLKRIKSGIKNTSVREQRLSLIETSAITLVIVLILIFIVIRIL